MHVLTNCLRVFTDKYPMLQLQEMFIHLFLLASPFFSLFFSVQLVLPNFMIK
jgi:hypothetical protein